MEIFGAMLRYHKPILSNTGKKLLPAGAYLTGADLRGANLRGAYLTGADLTGAYLRGAYLTDANLTGADLKDANLRGANLTGADLTGADLTGADLRGANLRGANLRGANLPKFQIPQEGTLTVFKKTTKGVIKLLIPETAKRTASLVGRKCRAEFVFVLEAPSGTKDCHSKTVDYTQGQTVYPDKYDDDIRIECTHGIHFFLTREEAEEY